jgi:hypothetical protein
MVAPCCVKVVTIPGGAIQVPTGEAPFQDITKSAITWRSRFAVTLAFQSLEDSDAALAGEV